jgi:hypothetical protein
MSSVRLSGNASGTGVFTIASPNSNTDRTLTLPNNTGTLLSSGSAGTVLQVVNATYATSVYNASATFIDTGLTASITPTSATSKILVLVNQSGVYASTTNNGVNIKLQRNSSDICYFAVAYAYGAAVILCSASTSYLDSPATTSSVTYKTVFARYSGAGTASVQGNSDVSTITLMEIAA